MKTGTKKKSQAAPTIKINMAGDILERGTVDVVPRADVENMLASGKKLRIKFGIDPSGPDIHLGHAVPLRKLKQFQNAGHQVVIIIGDWTARIGDPTGKNAMRPQLTPAQVKQNADKYLKQLFLILDKKKTEVQWQSKWFDKFGLQDVIALASKFTVAQLLDRDDFQDRQDANVEIGYHEPLYSLLQAYDSVIVKSDIEIGGTEQLFNLLKGRDLQQLYGQKPQGVLTLQILIGRDGALKMGKSTKNYIGLLDSPSDMYGKVMSIPDQLILQYFTLCTDANESELKEIERQLVSRSINPRDLKMQLARTIVTLYHSVNDALKAEESFVQRFQKKELPSEIEETSVKDWPETVVKLLVTVGAASSATEAQRLILGKGIKIDGIVIKDPKARIAPKENGILVARGKRFLKKVFRA